MSSSLTEQVLSAMLESASLATIKYIFMFAANFSSDSACSVLMQLIDRAPELVECNIQD